MSLPKLHVAVLMGGWSSERPVSLMSGEGVATALESKGHKVTRIDMDRDVALRLAEAKPDVVFNALHGTPGEDGTVQGMMDLMGLTYTHSGLATSVVAIDKELTKQALVPHGVPMPGVWAGSRNAGAIEASKATVSCPSGWPCASADPHHPARTRKETRAIPRVSARIFNLLEHFLTVV